MNALVSIVVTAGLVMGAAAAHAAAPEPSSLDSLVELDRESSARSASHGERAFSLAALCENGILFRPGPVNGRQAWKTSVDSAGTLRWAPRFAEISGDEDLAVTCGPWEIASVHGASSEPARGDYVSVWKRERGGEWCLALHMRIEGARTPGDLADASVERGPTHGKPKRAKNRSGFGVGLGVFHGGFGAGVGVGTGANYYEEQQRIVAHAIHTMMSAERELAFNLRKQGAARAYPKTAAEDVRFLREDAPPEVGMTPAIAALEKRRSDFEWRVFGSGVSTSADLGYSYGLVDPRGKPTGSPATGAYLHVWRKDAAGKWKLAVDVEDSFATR